MGELGIRSMKEINLAFLQKLIWNIMKKPDALWVNLLKVKYFPNSSFLEVVHVPGSSLVWKGINKVIAVLRESVFFIPRNGAELRIRNDPWIPNQVGVSPIWLQNAEQTCNLYCVAELVDENTGSWNAPLLNS